jgi:hypothetical protein
MLTMWMSALTAESRVQVWSPGLSNDTKGGLHRHG